MCAPYRVRGTIRNLTGTNYRSTAFGSPSLLLHAGLGGFDRAMLWPFNLGDDK